MRDLIKSEIFDMDVTIALATIAAIVVGPILAVIITRKLDREAQALDRKASVYRNLMRTRAIRLDPTHVGALNLVEVEFYGNDRVISSYQDYVRHLASPAPPPDEHERYFADRTDLFVELLFQMGRSLGYQFDKRDLERRAYSPLGWETDAGIQRRNAALLSEVLEGRRPLPITSVVASKSPYPPPPQDREL
jgi:hypothetical protein